MSEPADSQSDLAVFCHRLGSPLGTLVNHLYLLELDQEAMPTGARESLAATRQATNAIRELLDVARTWMDAQTRVLRPRRLDSQSLESLLGVQIPSPAGAVLDQDALAHLVKDLRADGERTGDSRTAEYVELVWASAKPAPPDLTDDDLRAHPLSSRCVSPRWACAQVLAERMGLGFKLRTGSGGKLEAAVRVPLDSGADSR